MATSVPPPFRKTLAAVLMEPLGFRLGESGGLKPESNSQLSIWMRRHLRIVIAPHVDRATLSMVEHAVVLRPPRARAA